MKRIIYGFLGLALISAVGSASMVHALDGTALQANPVQFNFNYVKGGALPADQNGGITNNGAQIVSAVVSISTPQTWLNGNYPTATLSLNPGQTFDMALAVAPQNLAVGNYTDSLLVSGNFTNAPLTIAVNLNVLAAGSQLPANLMHDDGTNVVNSNAVVYKLNNGVLTPYTSPDNFLSYSLNKWSNVQTANSTDMQLSTASGFVPFVTPRDGSLINDNGTIYITDNNYRQAFSSDQVFLDLGYSMNNIISGDISFLPDLSVINSADVTHPAGTIINNAGTICSVESIFLHPTNPGLQCFDSLADMQSWGISVSTVVAANSHDSMLPINGIIGAYSQQGSMNLP